MSKESSGSGNGLGLGTVMFLIFLTLQLTDHIDWEWYWIASPVWIPLGIAGVFYAIAGILFKIGAK